MLCDATLAKTLRGIAPGITVHGFRSSFRDWGAEQTAFPREVMEFALAHVNRDRVEAAYLRSDLFEKRRQLMAAWAAYLASEPPGQGARGKAPPRRRVRNLMA
jgi:integrase